MEVKRCSGVVHSGAKEIVHFDQKTKEDFESLVGDGTLLIDREGTAFAANELFMFVCERYETK